MSVTRVIRFMVVLLLLVAASPVHARDWFVRAGSSGDGSREKPFGDPFEALDKCEANDAIHIAQGRYTGKLESGQWNIPFDGIQLIGGYNDDWSQRDPWKYHTMLVWDRNAKNSPDDERIVATVRGVVIDGLVLDEAEQNEYDDTGRTPKSLDHATALVRLALPGTVRNCIFINTGREGIVCSNGSTIENNLFINTFDNALKINGLPPASPESKIPAIVHNNTFLWSWDDRAPGTGRDSGNAIYMSGPADISQNIFAYCDNNAIFSTLATERSSITNNVFFMNLWCNFKLFVDGQDVVVDDKTSDLWDETGLKASDGNQTANPGLALDPGWMEGTTKRTASEPGKANMDDWNKVRQALGLDLVGSGGKAASGIAPEYPLDKAVALMTPKDDSIKAGARIVKLEVKFAGATAAVPTKNYEKSDLATWADNPESVDGKSLEMTVAISSVANITGIPDAYKQDDYEGINIHDPTGNTQITGFYKKGTTVNRVVSDGAGYYSGSGKPDRLYTVQGIAYVVHNIPKAGFLIESIVPFDASGVVAKKIQGRDWFVRAGASGGDGSKEKPFRDPYLALDKCEAGDTIHVAGGEYVGKLHAGHWTIDCPNITMLGGYDKDFQTRDPWKNPTLLYTPASFKGSRGGYTLQGSDDHSNFVLDGFVFDKKLNNQYTGTGDLMPEESDKSPHLWLSRPGCVVRNCVFINGAEGAVRMTAAQTIENCIFLNHYKYVVQIEAGFTPTVPLVFKNNTVAFAWEERFGSGHGITADLLMLNVNVTAVVDNNIFEFADQHAIRLEADPKDVELTNNVFAHNLWAEVYQTKDDLVVDNKNFTQLSQLSWKKCENNQLLIPGLPLDQKWFDVYLNRTAYVPGKVDMDDWNQLREILDQPMIATGGKSAAGMAPAYDRNLVMAFVPKNAKCTAGARPVKLDVKFEGITREEEHHDYTDITWDTAANADEWNKLDGKRVSLKVAIERADNEWGLSDITQDKYSSWQVGGPEGVDSPGLPIRVYVPVATRVERMFRQAKGYSTGKVEETHIIKGIVRAPGQMVVEAVEKAD
jgi:hypothetical protein